MSDIFNSLKERFARQERCAEPSCAEGTRAGSGAKIVYPPDRAEIGRAAWKYVHERAANFDEINKDSEGRWLRSFIALFPCKHCAADFLEICSRMPPDFSTRQNYQKWWVAAHNAVNRDLGKPQF